MITQLSRILDVDVSTLLLAAAKSEEAPQIIIVDENKEAIEYARLNPVALAVLDIELGTASGLDLCRTLIEINPRTNVVYLTAFPDYALPAWESKACGFIVKPLTPEKVRLQLEKLRYPISFGSSGGEDL